MEEEAQTVPLNGIDSTTSSLSTVLKCAWPKCENDKNHTLLRCSVCKQTNYCSAEHQKLDWKSHKKKCFQLALALPLPPPTALSVPFELDDEFAAIIAPLSALVSGIADGIRAKNDDIWGDSGRGRETVLDVDTAAELLEPLLNVEFPPRFEFEPMRKRRKTLKYRSPLFTISRLFVIDFVARLTEEEDRKTFAELFKNLSLPTHEPDLTGPNVLGHPADLLPSNYHIVVQLCSIFCATEHKLAEDIARFGAMTVVLRNVNFPFPKMTV